MAVLVRNPPPDPVEVVLAWLAGSLACDRLQQDQCDELRARE